MASAEQLQSAAIQHWLARFLILFPALIVAYILAQIPLGLVKPLGLSETAVLIWVLAAMPLLILVYVGLVRLVEGRRAVELEARRAVGGLISGTMIGFLLLSVVIGTIVWFGFGTVTLPHTIVFPLAALSLSLLSGVGEELAFRGGMFRIFEERFGTLAGLVVSAAFFGGVHIINPGATLASSIAIALEAGLLLGLAYTATRSLWLPIGLHFAWNFTEGGVFATEVSGNKVPGILATKLNGPELMTGGAFGPEASVISVVLCLALAAIFLVITLRRDQWKPLTLRAPRTE